MSGNDSRHSTGANALERVCVRTRARAFNLRAEASRIGGDVLICIYGGESPHIGAVAAAQPRPSLKDGNITSATASVLTYPGHKDDVLAKEAAESIAAALKTNVVVTAGVHWDDLDREGIRTVLTNSRRLIKRLIKKLK